MNIGIKIKEGRKTKKFNQDELAKKIHVKKSLISEWENNKSTPTPKEMEKLEKVLGIELNSVPVVNNTDYTSLKIIYILVLVLVPGIFFYVNINDSINTILSIYNANLTVTDAVQFNAIKTVMFQLIMIPYIYYGIASIANYIFYKLKSTFTFFIALVIEIIFVAGMCFLSNHADLGFTAIMLFIVPTITGLVQYIIMDK